MYSREDKLQTFMHDLQRYIDMHRIDVSDNRVIDTFIENPDVQYLISTWLKEPQNDIQLYHVLVDLPQILDALSEEGQSFVMDALFNRARQLRTWMPESTDFDLAVQTMPNGSVSGLVQKPEPTKDNWSMLNRELLTIPEDDISKLNAYKVWINADVLNANTVLDMDQNSHVAFGAQIKKIIEENPSLYRSDKKDRKKLVPVMFTDELVARVKIDPVIQRILATVIPFVPKTIIKPDSSTQNDTTEAQTHQEHNPQNNHARVNLLLGIEDTDDDISSITSSVNLNQLASNISDTAKYSEENLSSDDSLSQSDHTTEEDRSTPSISLTAWQMYHIQSNEQVGILVNLKQLDPNQIPDRALTQKEIIAYDNQYARALNSPNLWTKDMRLESKTTPDSPPPYRRHSVDNQQPQRKTRAQEWNATIRANKHAKPQREFYGVVKDNTQNTIYQEVNRNQRKYDYLGPDNGKMPAWHTKWMEILKQREQGKTEGHDNKNKKENDSSFNSHPRKKS